MEFSKVIKNYNLYLKQEDSILAENFYGYDITNSKQVYVKVISNKSIPEQSILRKHLNKEIAIQEKLKLKGSKNVLCIIDKTFTKNNIYLIYQNDRYQTMKSFLNYKKMVSEKECLDYFIQIYYGYCELYTIQSNYRDMTLSNILIGDEDNIKIDDFGLFKFLYNEKESLLQYRINEAPETKKNRLLYTKDKSDSWSIGVILYQLLFLSDPQIMQQQLIIPQNRFISNEMISFIQSLLQTDPSKRLSWNQILNHPCIKNFIENEKKKDDWQRQLSCFLNPQNTILTQRYPQLIFTTNQQELSDQKQNQNQMYQTVQPKNQEQIVQQQQQDMYYSKQNQKYPTLNKNHNQPQQPICNIPQNQNIIAIQNIATIQANQQNQGQLQQTNFEKYIINANESINRQSQRLSQKNINQNKQINEGEQQQQYQQQNRIFHQQKYLEMQKQLQNQPKIDDMDISTKKKYPQLYDILQNRKLKHQQYAQQLEQQQNQQIYQYQKQNQEVQLQEQWKQEQNNQNVENIIQNQQNNYAQKKYPIFGNIQEQNKISNQKNILLEQNSLKNGQQLIQQSKTTDQPIRQQQNYTNCQNQLTNPISIQNNKHNNQQNNYFNQFQTNQQAENKNIVDQKGNQQKYDQNIDILQKQISDFDLTDEGIVPIGDEHTFTVNHKQSIDNQINVQNNKQKEQQNIITINPTIQEQDIYQKDEIKLIKQLEQEILQENQRQSKYQQNQQPIHTNQNIQINEMEVSKRIQQVPQIQINTGIRGKDDKVEQIKQQLSVIRETSDSKHMNDLQNLITDKQIFEMNVKILNQELDKFNILAKAVERAEDILQAKNNLWIVVSFFILKRLYLIRNELETQLDQHIKVDNQFKRWKEFCASTEYQYFMIKFRKQNEMIYNTLYYLQKLTRDRIQKLNYTVKEQLLKHIPIEDTNGYQANFFVHLHFHIISLQEAVNKQNDQAQIELLKHIIQIQDSLLIVEQGLFVNTDEFFNLQDHNKIQMASSKECLQEYIDNKTKKLKIFLQYYQSLGYDM